MIISKPCAHCGNEKYYQLGNGQLKCKSCRKRRSETSGTSLNNLKLSIDQLFKITNLICNKRTVSIKVICEITGVSFVTAQKRKQLITSAIIETNSVDPYIILDKLSDNGKINSVIRSMKGLQDDEVLKAREMHKKGIKIKEIARIFCIDQSNASKIVKGKLYKYLPL